MPFDPVQANRYAYAGCNPVNYTDPSGLDRDHEPRTTEDQAREWLRRGAYGIVLGAGAGALAAWFTGSAAPAAFFQRPPLAGLSEPSLGVLPVGSIPKRGRVREGARGLSRAPR